MNSSGARGFNRIWRPDPAPIVLAVCGDKVVGKTLALLLSDSCFDVRFVTASSLDEPGSLAGVELLLVAPTLGLNAARRESFAVMLANAAEAAEVPILKLIPQSEMTPEKQVGLQHAVPWPCSIEELKRRIEYILLAGSAADGPSTTVG